MKTIKMEVEDIIINVMDRTIVGMIVAAVVVWAPHVYRFTQNGYWF